MANRWGNVETVTDFIFWGSKITADGVMSLSQRGGGEGVVIVGPGHFMVS